MLTLCIPRPRIATWLPLATCCVSLLATGCSNEAPILAPLSDQHAFVNQGLAVSLSAVDADDDDLLFRFESSTENLDKRASIQPLENGRALFSWTPLSADLGVHAFDFIVTDGMVEARASIQISVSRSGEGGTQPVFVKPLGSGTTLDVADKSCLDVPIAVEDSDSLEVTLGQLDPALEGATVTQETALSGNWRFCPTPAQVDTSDRYTVVLSADDGDNPPTLKEYLVVLRNDTKSDCPGAPPTISHQEKDESTIVDISILADVSDDKGIKYEPLFYYSAAPVADDPDLSQMTQLTMSLQSGDMKSGTWEVSVPNPVANAGAGATAKLYYLIVAQDNDDAEGSCDHLSQAPTTGSYSITITNPGGSGGLSVCEECTADAQCGSVGDNCIFLDGKHHCGKACTVDTDCPGGYYCSISQFTSIDNVKARQCLPTDYKCDNGGNSNTCVDDSYEENDTIAQAKLAPLLVPGSHGPLKSCPAVPSGDDEDWYEITIGSDRTVTLALTGGGATDLDIALTNDNGTMITKSDSLGSQESVSTCLTPGTYFVHVYAWGSSENSYTLDYSESVGSCALSCIDDVYEDDDNIAQARFVALGNSAYTATGNEICAGDDDFFDVFLLKNEVLHSTLNFTQTTSAEDLDIYIYDDQGNNLTGCTEQTPGGCDSGNGQSGTSNESFSWPINATGTYYVVVHGWNGAENSYDICIGLSAQQCP